MATSRFSRHACFRRIAAKGSKTSVFSVPSLAALRTDVENLALCGRAVKFIAEALYAGFLDIYILNPERVWQK